MRYIYGMRLLMIGLLAAAFLTSCVSRQTWEAVALHVEDDLDECEHLETITETRSYGAAPELFWTFPFVLITGFFAGGPSESDSRAARRHVDADILADVKNQAAKVEGANAVSLRTTKKTDWSITMEADALFCDRW